MSILNRGVRSICGAWATPWALALILQALPSPGVAGELRVDGQRWAIASGHPRATAAGAEVLRRGGNVIDAAVTASLTLGVAEPYGSGLGGKLVLLYRDAKTGDVTCIEALCASAAATDPDEFASLPTRRKKYGYRSVCVPGLPAGLEAAHKRWGSEPWSDLVAPAEKLAREGIVLSEAMRSLWSPHARDLAADPEAARWFLIDGKTPEVGDRLPNAALGDTLARLAEHGADDFYRGETARRLVAALRAGGSPMTEDDFSRYEARVVEPLAANYRGYRVFSSPPPLTGGVTVLAALRASEACGEEPHPVRNADYIDRLGTVLRVFYPKISLAIADTRQASREAAGLLSNDSIREAASAVTGTASRRVLDEATLDDAPAAGTSHLVVADAEGNMVSLTQSLSLHFGAAVVAPGTGVVLNNSMNNFATSWKASPNYIAGEKRPRSTVSPVLATSDGMPSLALGIPGGQRIPTTTLQLLVDILGARTPIETAFARPRFHLRRPLNSRQPDNHIDLEEGLDGDRHVTLREELRARGWLTETKPQNGRYFGGGNAIQYLPGGKLVAVADSRRTNDALAE